mmetsp:Transcript_7478/g.22703  ORF Transcript_7478/g.22703 Transcript_7478/m.22703 type:complete len:532 (+) Transcript_7478:91-1686(+)
MSWDWGTGAVQTLSVGVAALAARFALRREREDELEEAPAGLPVWPTLALAAGWSLVSWINTAEKKDVVQTKYQLEFACDLEKHKRKIAVCTTASVPWLTGTAVNPAIRALELSKLGHRVALLIPWLNANDQPIVFSGKKMFDNKEQQADYVRSWMRDILKEQGIEGVELPEICFYYGGYARDVGSVYPLSDIVSALPTGFDRDILLLEEPEHLTWYYYGDRLPHQFRFVVGVIHTNYIAYAVNWDFPMGLIKGGLLWFYNKWCTRTHTHRIIKLSDAMQGFPRQITCNVHGVRERFLSIGSSADPESFSHGAYFVGKLVWQKGYNRLIPLLKFHYEKTGEAVTMEWFGAGENYEEIRATAARESSLRNIVVKGAAVDHTKLTDFKVLVNASDSEGLATVTLEAIAMGKMVLIPDHPCNKFFSRFRNAYLYRSRYEFSDMLSKVLKATPHKLTDEEQLELSWKGGMERFVEACRTNKMRGPVDRFAANALSRIMPIVSAKVFEDPQYAEIMSDVKRQRAQSRTTTTAFQMVR